MKINEQIQKFEIEVLTPKVDYLMATEYSVAPPNLFIPEKIWKDRKRSELMAFLSGKNNFSRIDSALECLSLDFKTNLTPIEIQKLREEWGQGVEKINNLSEDLAEEAPAVCPFIPLRKIMNVSNESIELFYAAGVRLFQKQEFIRAADVFYLLALIDFQKHNIWLSLGLSEMKIPHFEQALNAFAMAALTKNDAPLPYIYSAKCCIALERYQESSIYLTLARKALGSLPQQKQEILLGQIIVLEQQSKF